MIHLRIYLWLKQRGFTCRREPWAYFEEKNGLFLILNEFKLYFCYILISTGYTCTCTRFWAMDFPDCLSWSFIVRNYPFIIQLECVKCFELTWAQSAQCELLWQSSVRHPSPVCVRACLNFFIQLISPLKPLIGFWPNFTGMIPKCFSTKVL